MPIPSLFPATFLDGRRQLNVARVVFIVVLGLMSTTILATHVFGQGFSVIKTINVDTEPFGDQLSPDGTKVWVANSGGFGPPNYPPNSNTVTLIDVSTLTEEPNKITVGLFPEDIAFGRLGLRAFVTNSTSDSLSVISTLTNTVTQTVDLSPVPLDFPISLAVSADGRQIFVTTDGDFGLVAVLQNSLSGVTIKGSIPIPGGSGRPAVVPFSLLNPSMFGKVLIPSSPAENGPPTLSVIDPNTDTIVNALTLPGNTGFPQAVVVSPDAHYAYETLLDFSGGTGGVWVIDLTTLTTVTVINTGDPYVYGAALTHDGRYLFVTNFVQDQFVVINPATNTIVTKVAVGDKPNDIAITYDNTEVFVTNEYDTTVSVISIP